MFLDLSDLVKTVGYLGVFAIVFAESGLFFGFFLPGDSLLFTAGLLASQGFFNFPLLITICVIGAILGDSVGYWFGHKVTRALFSRPSSRFFRKDHLSKAHDFYEKHGAKTIILARFIPIIRTFAPIVAGISAMTYRKFLSYNIIGALIWGVGVTALGYTLGNVFPNIDRFLFPIILVIIALSVSPGLYHYASNRRHANRKS